MTDKEWDNWHAAQPSGSMSSTVVGYIAQLKKERDHYKALLKSCEEMKEDFRRHLPYGHGR